MVRGHFQTTFADSNGTMTFGWEGLGSVMLCVVGLSMLQHLHIGVVCVHTTCRPSTRGGVTGSPGSSIKHHVGLVSVQGSQFTAVPHLVD